ncbi:MAG: hypothetical protein HYZ11_09870 [Candidatus Tectomicrobia bacterium]|uniref:Uncharacterized protein n=1 Tax=Tectimicrobiota bacterium TaxID=2528274 RepID=A0A932MM51_UNCTE|nr:hypothetical protein [Candidatus Tectomicrobia bacterium]
MGDLLFRDRQTIGATEERELTADSAGASTLADAALTEADDFWNGSILKTIRGAGAGQQRAVSDFDALSDTLTVTPAWTVQPAAGTRYLLDRPAPAAELFRAGSFRHDLNIERLERAVKDASLSPFPAVMGKRSARLSFATELRGSGAAGVPPDYGVLFRACGMSQAVAAGASVAYKPTSDKAAFTRACITVYLDGLRILYLGCMGTFSIELPLDGVPAVNWDFTAADFLVSDAALVEGSAYQEVIPAPVMVTGFSFAGFNFDISRLTLALNNTVVLRQSANVPGGHIGALVTRRAPSGSFDPEAVLKGTKDLFADWEAGAQAALAAVIGSQPGNICTLAAPKCQYTGAGFGDRNGLLAYEAPFVMNRSAGDDELTITFT